MKYRIDTSYCWYNHKQQIVLMYFINQVPFTFDDLPEFVVHDSEIVDLANNQKSYETEDLYKAYQYLMEEECHPLVFELELENEHLLPLDMNIKIWYSKSMKKWRWDLVDENLDSASGQNTDLSDI